MEKNNFKFKVDLDKINNDTNVKRSEKYKNDPYRAETFMVLGHEPFNAETPSEILIEHFITPTKIFLKRNHGPIPDLKEDGYSININLFGKNIANLELRSIKENFEKVQITAILACAGLRRNGLNDIKKVEGIVWKGSTLGNAVWGGASLKTVLEFLFKNKLSKDQSIIKYLNSNNIFHIETVGHETDHDNDKEYYRTSIPVYKACSEETLLAYEMNNEPLNRDHGFPLRLIVPGYAGARCVKWIKEINLITEESTGKYQQKDYKLFTNNKERKNITEKDWKMAETIKDFNINSYICNIKDKEVIKEFPFTVKGYAFSNGNKITRVDITLNEGKNYEQATLISDNKNTSLNEKNFAWTFWEYTITEEMIKKFSNNPKRLKISVRAWDTTSNTQPTDAKTIWNFRGLMNNSIHSVECIIAENGNINSKF